MNIRSFKKETAQFLMHLKASNKKASELEKEAFTTINKKYSEKEKLISEYLKLSSFLAFDCDLPEYEYGIMLSAIKYISKLIEEYSMTEDKVLLKTIKKSIVFYDLVLDVPVSFYKEYYNMIQNKQLENNMPDSEYIFSKYYSLSCTEYMQKAGKEIFELDFINNIDYYLEKLRYIDKMLTMTYNGDDDKYIIYIVRRLIDLLYQDDFSDSLIQFILDTVNYCKEIYYNKNSKKYSFEELEEIYNYRKGLNL